MNKMVKSSATFKNDVRYFAGICAGYVAGLSFSYSTVIFVEPLMRAFSIGETRVGFITGLSVIGLAIAPFLIASRISIVSLTHLATVGYALVVVGSVIILSFYGPIGFVVGRLIAGTGEGLILSAANAAGAGAERPELAFGVAQVTILISIVGTFALSEFLVEKWGYQAGVALMLAITTLSFLILRLYPLAHHQNADVSRKDPVIVGLRARLPYPAIGAAFIVAYGMVLVADGMIWTFALKLGEQIGMSSRTLSLALGNVNLVGLLGALSASKVSAQFGKIIPLLIAMLSIGAVCMGLVSTEHHAVFMLLYYAESLLLCFIMPFFMGLLSVLDTGGAWTNFSATAISLALSIAPALGGIVVGATGYHSLGYASATLILLAVLLVTTTVSLGSAERSLFFSTRSAPLNSNQLSNKRAGDP